jgi:alkylated DNA repair dioxygenase AlkB
MVYELATDPCHTRYDNVPDETLLTLEGRLYSQQQCRELLASLIRDIDWQYDYHAFGRRFDVPRVQAWYADPGIHYRYSNNMLEHRPWIPLLSGIRKKIEARTGHRFNSVLVTYYRDGNDHVTYHADNEPELGETPFIASLSFGATREFHYRHKRTGEIRGMRLHDGELLMMQPAFQHDWEHCVPMEPEISAPRINLTFRQVYLSREESA